MLSKDTKKMFNYLSKKLVKKCLILFFLIFLFDTFRSYFNDLFFLFIILFIFFYNSLKIISPFGSFLYKLKTPQKNKFIFYKLKSTKTIFL